MAKFDQNKTYIPNIQAWIDALGNGHFNRKHNTVWTALNKATDPLIIAGRPIPGKDLKNVFRIVTANYPGTGTRGATDQGAANAGRHISALVRMGVLKSL